MVRTRAHQNLRSAASVMDSHVSGPFQEPGERAAVACSRFPACRIASGIRSVSSPLRACHMTDWEACESGTLWISLQQPRVR